jgi:hypothetical protein
MSVLFLATHDDPANIPIQRNEFAIDCTEGVVLRRANARLDRGEKWAVIQGE